MKKDGKKPILDDETLKAICEPYDALARKYNNTSFAIFDEKGHPIGNLEEGDDGFIGLRIESNMAYHKIWHYPSRTSSGKPVTSYFKAARHGKYPIYTGPKYKEDHRWVNYPGEIVRKEFSDAIKKYNVNYDDAMSAFDSIQPPPEKKEMENTTRSAHIKTMLYDEKRNEVGQLSENETMFLKLVIKGKKSLYVMEYPTREGREVSIKRLKPEQFIISPTLPKKKLLTKEEFDKIDNHSNEERTPYLGLGCKGYSCDDMICPSCCMRYQNLAWINKLLDGEHNWDDFADNERKRQLMNEDRRLESSVREHLKFHYQMYKEYKNTSVVLHDDSRKCIGSLEEGNDGFVRLILDGKKGHHSLILRPGHEKNECDSFLYYWITSTGAKKERVFRVVNEGKLSCYIESKDNTANEQSKKE